MDNNIILQIIKEVEFFKTRVYLEIFAKERHAYFILSEYELFDIDLLKKYLIDNNLNQFARSEIENLLRLIDYFSTLYVKYREIPISENFYHYKNENSLGKKECSGWATPFYFLRIDDKFKKINEENFKEKHQSELKFTFLTASRISTKLNDIKDLFTKYLESTSSTFEPNKQPKAVKSDEVLRNEFDKIFNSDIGFTIFTKMFDLYKTENTDLANFSFLFYAMEKEFLLCSQTEFITFLGSDKYDVSIEKIDSRQSGKNKKSKLYNSIKETLQKKHEKSTT